MTSSSMSRRNFLRLSAGVTTTALAAACVPATTPAGGTGGAAATAPIELSFDMYNFEPWLKALDEMFKVYMKDHADVKVKLESAPDTEFWSRQEARLAAGTPPDLSIGDPQYFGRYAHKGYYLDLAPFVEKDKVALDKWFETNLSDCRYDKATGIVGQGALFGMPATYVGTVLYYNKDLFDAAKLSYPDDTWDRNKLLEAAQALTLDSQGNNATAGGFNPEDIAQWGITMINRDGISTTVWNNGGELINKEQTECKMTEPATVEMFDWLAALLNTHHVHPTPAQLQGVPNPFQVAKVAMSIDGSWNLDTYNANLKFKWDIAPIPKGTVGLDRVTYAGTNTVHAFKQSAHVDAAWQLLQFLVGPTGMQYFAKTGTPCLKETANSDEYLKGGPEHRKVVVDLGKYARNYYPGLKSDQWKQIYNAEIEALWLNKGTAQTVMQTICDKITPILQTPIDQL
ncbi:sugar ABC transporter substrate-binding protein [soil metagenome]